jgi:hypothetical protein
VPSQATHGLRVIGQIEGQRHGHLPQGEVIVGVHLAHQNSAELVQQGIGRV